MKNTKLFVVFMLILLGVWGIWRFWPIATPFVAAVIIAYLLTPIVNLLCKKLKFPRLLATLVTVIFALGVVVAIISAIAAFAVSQMTSLAGDLMSYASNYDQLISGVTEYLTKLRMPDFVISAVQNFLAESDSYLATFFNSIVSSIVSVSLGIVDVIVTIILTVYFCLDGSKILDFLANQLPTRGRIAFRRVLHESNELTWRYFRSRVLLSLGMGIVTYIGLLIMGIKYALLFALLSFLMDFIPYFGSIIAGVIEIFYALITGSLGLAIAVAIFVLVVQQVEGNIVAPKMQGDATGIHPVVIMFALLACNSIWGPLGMFISTPIAIIFRTVLREIRNYLMDDGAVEDPKKI